MPSSPLKKILMVEDDPDIQAIAGLALRSLGGYEVLACSHGADAVARAPEFGPDLVLLDVMMPGMDGPSTYRALRALPGTAATPVVFMTARAQRHEVEAYFALGAADVIRKPFDPMALPERLAATWRAANG